MNSVPYLSNSMYRYRKVAIITLVAVYFLIIVGSTVRVSGAGMGCPDWPTCFGRWIPPTEVSQLPSNYQQIYADRGYANVTFNVVKTWTEYVNRLIGVVIGLLIFATAWLSFSLRKYQPSITYASVGAFLGVAFEGWLGSQVVASNLQPGIITLHMFGALMVVAMLIYALHRLQTLSAPYYSELLTTNHKLIEFSIWSLGILLAVQILMGTQVREMIDFSSKLTTERSVWVEWLPWFFYVHRSFSAFFLALHLWFFWYLYKNLSLSHYLTKIQFYLLLNILISVISGSVLNHLGFPMFAQPLHLISASTLFGLHWLLLLRFYHWKKLVRES